MAWPLYDMLIVTEHDLNARVDRVFGKSPGPLGAIPLKGFSVLCGWHGLMIVGIPHKGKDVKAWWDY